MNLAFEAMLFAREAHKNQRRKYTNQPYFDHLAEVAGITASVFVVHDLADYHIATAFLHDCVEDCGVSRTTLDAKFGLTITEGVMWLSDLEEGNRVTRKALSRERLSRAPSWVQTIKVADLISNTSSIVAHDPKFAVVYLEEKRALLEVLTKADRRLHALAVELANQEVKL